MKALVALMLAAAPLGGCATAAPSTAIDGRAGLGQRALVGALVVTPLRLVEDSRCPVGVQCVWAGRLVIAARIDGAGWSENANLELGKDHRTRGTGLALVAAAPAKAAGSDVAPGAYRFIFEPR